MNDIDLKKYLVDGLKNDFWRDFNDVLSTELNLLKEEIFSKLESPSYLRTQEDESILIDILATFGYIPYREIDSSNEYLKKLIKLLSYRVLYRATVAGYRLIFSLIKSNGQVYTCYNIGDSLYRNLDTSLLELEFNKDINKIGISSSVFSVVEGNPLILDQGEGFTLDLGSNPDQYTLDADEKGNNHHIIAESCIDRLITKNSIEYSVTQELMEYLYSEIEYTRKAIDFPHIGFQNSIKIDNTGFTNSISGDPLYYNNIIKSQVCAVIPGYNFNAINYESLELSLGNEYKGCLSEDYPTLNSDVIGHWGFDDIVNTTTFIDYSTNSYTGAIAGTISNNKQNIDIIGSSLYLNGVDNTAIAPSVTLADSDLSFGTWFKSDFMDTTDTSDIVISELNNTTDTLSFILNLNSNLIQLKYDFNGDVKTIDYTPSDYVTFINEVHCLTVNIDKTVNTIEFFIDGVSVGIETILVNDISGTYSLNIATATTKYKGYVDEIRLYQRVLTSSEILYLYQSKLGYAGYINEISETYTSFVEAVNDFSTHVSVIMRLEFNDSVSDLVYFKEFMLSYLGTDIVYGNYQQIEMTGTNHFTIQFLFIK